MTSRIGVFKEKLDNKHNNIVNHIPFSFRRLRHAIPGLIPGVMYKITSHTGNGKTQFAKSIVFDAVRASIRNKTKLDIVYVAMEESQEEFIDSVYLYIVNVIMKVPLDYYTMHSLHETNTLTQGQVNALVKAESAVKLFMEKIHLVTDVYTPIEVFEACKKVANKYGDVDDFDQWTVNEGEEDRIFMVVADHISLMRCSGQKLHDSIAEWHTDYCKRILSKEWKWIVINIQQQSLDAEKSAFTSTGKKIIDKVIPSLDGLGDNRTVVRDDYVVIGLFSPARYHIDTFAGYQISGNEPHALGDNIRIIYVLKNRLGIPNRQVPLFFDGSCSYFSDLPYDKDPEVVERFLKERNDQFNINTKHR